MNKDLKEYKKILNNSISYNIQKAMNTHDNKLDNILKKMHDDNETSLNLIYSLKKNTDDLVKKIDYLENLILDLKKNHFSNNSLEDLSKESSKDSSKESSKDLSKESSKDSSKESSKELSKESLSKESLSKESLSKESLSKESLSKDLSKESLSKESSKDLSKNGSKKNLSKKLSKDLSKDSSNDYNFNYKDLKEEYIELDFNFVKTCLDSANIESDIKMFKKMYIDNIPKEYYPIRHIKKKFQYWLDGHMNDDDTNATYIKNTILNNIEKYYLKVNIYENYVNDLDQFLKNQDYINKLHDEKYKDKFLSKIILIIDI
jgi:hypothetical protein